MTAALPRLKTQPIPGGDFAPPPAEPDGIGDIISGVADLLHGDHETPEPDQHPEDPPH
jgi:penicillin-binding protein 1A